jgi:hypothetical protein
MVSTSHMKILATKWYVLDILIYDLDKTRTVDPIANKPFEDYNIVVTNALLIIHG